jgi:SAM-dependent methyltransferase
MAPTQTRPLHLGCFDAPADGWINTDITPHIWVSKIPMAARALHLLGKISPERFAQHQRGVFKNIVYLNVAKNFDFPSDSFGAVFTCHMLEHLYPSTAERCVGECHRVLCHGGVLRIVVPDLDKMIAEYDASNPESFLDSIFQYGSGHVKNAHHWHYNFNSLRALLLKIGFSRVERRAYQVGDCPDIEYLDKRPESLFVEAYK